jgi:hypothetical protein
MKSHAVCMMSATALYCAIIAPSLAADLPKCHKSAKVWNNCAGTYTFSSGARYVGEWKNNLQSGQGKYIFAEEGGQYIGEFRDGKMNGQGIFTYGPNSQYFGQTYTGEFKAGEFSGQGTVTYPDGNKYVGRIYNGIKNGYGTFTWSPNSEGMSDEYSGEWEDDKPNGQGTYKYEDGNIDEGIWKNGKFQHPQKPSL